MRLRLAVQAALAAVTLHCAVAPVARVAADEAVPAGPAASSSQSLFDPARHMRVAEVRPGMKGHGLSVFKGTTIERFDVEVLSVLRNFNPKYDVVLIACKGANLEHTGSIAGMSGSPVYLKDDAGRERMIGAFAWGWPLAKDPVAGVTPIEYMLAMPSEPKRAAVATGKTTTKPAGAARAADPNRPAPRMQWSVLDASPARHRNRDAATPLLGAKPEGNAFANAPRLQKLATPLMVSGLSPRMIEQFGPALAASGLVPLQAGGAGAAGGGGAASADEVKNAKLEPGSAMVVTLLRGDAELNAVGTCTEVLGDRVYGFGHPFNNEGAVELPMAAGRVNGVIANLMTSFKLGAVTKPMGRLTTDQLAGVVGRLGESPAMVPLEFDVTYADGSRSDRYRFESALHPKFTPLLTGMAFGAAVGGASELPQYNTVDYELTLEFANGRSVRVADRAVNASPMELFQMVGLTMVAAADNPFERVLVKRVSGTAKVTPEARQAQVVDVNVPRSKYHPGETLKAFVTYRPFRSAEAVMPVEVELPKDLPQGQYQLVISDADRFIMDEQASKPFRFTAEGVDEVFDVLRDLTSLRHDALYVRLLRQPDGIAIGRTAMPQLPSSRRQIFMAAGRSNTTPFVSSTVKVLPTDRVMEGSAEFVINIETKTKVESGGAPGGPTSRPAAPAAKPEEPKPPRSPAPRDAPAPAPVEPKDAPTAAP